jgi:hypothetical protein
MRIVVIVILVIWDHVKSAISSFYWRISDWHYRRQVSG